MEAAPTPRTDSTAATDMTEADLAEANLADAGRTAPGRTDADLANPGQAHADLADAGRAEAGRADADLAVGNELSADGELITRVASTPGFDMALGPLPPGIELEAAAGAAPGASPRSEKHTNDVFRTRRERGHHTGHGRIVRCRKSTGHRRRADRGGRPDGSG